MSSIEAALAATDLGEFEDDAILGVGIEIPGAAGGLRDAMEIEPIVMHKGDRVRVLLDCTVGKIRFDPVKDTEGWRRVHILVAEGATIVEGDVFEEALDAQRVKIERAREAAEGTQRLPLPDELAVQHGEGAHEAGLVDGCPTCQDELDAEAAEAEQT